MQKFCYLLHTETRPMKSWNCTGIFDLNLTDLLHWLQRLNPSASSLLSVSKHIFITMELSRNLVKWPMLIFSREKYGFVNVAVLYEIFLQFHFWIHIQYLLTVYMHQPICRQLTAMELFPWKQTESVKLFYIVANSYQLDFVGPEQNFVAWQQSRRCISPWGHAKGYYWRTKANRRGVWVLRWNVSLDNPPNKSTLWRKTRGPLAVYFTSQLRFVTYSSSPSPLTASTILVPSTGATFYCIFCCKFLEECWL